MGTRWVRREVVAALAAIGLAACSAAAAGSPDVPVDTVTAGVPSGTVGGVGNLPSQVAATHESPSSASVTEPKTTADDLDGDDEDLDAPGSSSTSTTRPRPTTTTTTIAPTKTIGEQVIGNRVLMLGDSVLASTSRRYGNNMCANLVPLGWDVEVEAEVSREISFGNRVLASRMSAGWDAAVVLLGNNYGAKPDVFMKELDKILTTLSPRPVLLLTVTEFEPIQREVNDIIRAVAEFYPNVTVVDWAAMSRLPGVLGDGLHLTPDGREFLAQQLVPYFGFAPVQPGDCLASKFHDDSAGSVNGPSGNNTGGKVPTTTGKPTGTTVKPATTPTTVKPTGSTSPPTTTVKSTGSSPPTTVGSATTVTTAPQPTSPPQTSAPQPTSPPATSPPQTSPGPPITLPPGVTLPPPPTEPPGP